MSHTVNLEGKSLLLMLPRFQDRYWHGVPREPDLKGARVNLTFRYVKPQEKPDPTPEPERDMTKVNQDRADMLQYVMRRLNSEDKA